MSSSDEEKNYFEEKFEKTIEDVFGKDRWKDEELLNKYKKVIEQREENLKNGKKAEDGCGKYGDDPTTIELMLYIRKLMREEKLIPDVPLKFYIQSESVTIENFKNFIVHDGKNRSWLTTEYEERFPISYRSEPESHFGPHNSETESDKWDYLDDGWDYSKYLEENSLNADKEWFFEIKGKRGHNDRLGHIYYNELDHYLTFLVYAIRTNKTCDRSRHGVNIKKDL